MGFGVLLGYCFFGLILFLLINGLKIKYKITFFEQLAFSLIYLFFLAGFCAMNSWQIFNDDIFLVLVFELVIRIIYVTYILEQDFFAEEGIIKKACISIIIGYIVNHLIFNQVSEVFLSAEELKSIAWLFIAIFLFIFFKEKAKEENQNEKTESLKIDKKHIVVQYAKLKYLFGEEIQFKNQNLQLIFYAIMIYYNDKRPIFFRKIDNFLFRLNGKPRKLGIMQIQSKKMINDFESIEIAKKKLERIDEKKKEKKNWSEEIITSFQKENAKLIINIYEELKQFLN